MHNNTISHDVRDLSFSEIQAEFLASRLQGWNLLQ